MTLSKIFTGMEKGPEAIDANFNDINTRIPDAGQYYTKSEVDNKVSSVITDTGWVKVPVINGWQGDISVRLQNGVIYHKGYFGVTGPNTNISLTVFKYPDNFGDMSTFNQFNGGWQAFTSDGNPNYGFIKGATKEFWCWIKGTNGMASVSDIVFKL